MGSVSNARNQLDHASYDAAGNLTQDPSGSTPRHTYSYDGDGLLISVDGNSTAQYAYDSLGQRIRRQASYGVYQDVFDAFGRRVSEYTSGNALAEATINSDTGPIAYRSGGGTTFEHQNWVGTERLRTTYNGAVQSQVSSLPFGDAYTSSAGQGDDRDFAMLNRDQETNEEQALYREYTPTQGHWLSPDPYYGSYDFTNPQSFNRYAYVMNSPLSFVDPSGMDCDPSQANQECNHPHNCVYSDQCGDDPNGNDPGNGSSADGSSGGNASDGGNINVVFDFGTILFANAGASAIFDFGTLLDFYFGGIGTTAGGGGAGSSNAVTIRHCLGVAAADKGLSIALDAVGSIPAVGNAVSGATGVVRAGIAINHVITSTKFAVGSGVYGAYGGVTAGPEEATDSLVGSASAGTGIGLALADASLAGTKAIPIVGNVASGLTGLWDGYQAYQKYRSCMAGHE